MEDLIPNDAPFPVCSAIEDLRNQGAFQKDFRLLLPSDIIESEQRFSEILQIEYQRYHGKSQTVELETGEKQNRKEELFLYPFQHNNASTIRKILERDSYCRKRKQWPLIPLSDYTKYTTISAGMFDIPLEDDLFVCGSLRPNDSFEIAETKELIERLYINFEGIKGIMKKYQGKIAVCGGALTRICLPYADRSDVDIFFYNIDSEEEANMILLDCISIIVEQTLKEAENEYEIDRLIRVEHRLYVTNVIIYDRSGYSDDPREVYQFIHRIYPTLDSIIGGFDLGPSSLCFDGNDIYGTELGIFSIAKRCLIVDTTRRSLSFEHRIYKLSRLGFSIVFPGLNAKKMKEVLSKPNQFQLEDRSRKIFKLMEMLGLQISFTKKVFVPQDGFKDMDDFRENQYGTIDLPYSQTIDSVTPIIKVGDITLQHQPDANFINKVKNSINDQEETPKKVLSIYSDYCHYSIDLKDRIPKVNTNFLCINNLEGVIAYIEFDKDDYQEDTIYPRLLELFTNPEVEFEQNYKNNAYDYLIYRENEMNLRREHDNKIRYMVKTINSKKEKKDEPEIVSYVNRYPRNTRKEVQLFAEFLPKIRRLQREFPQEALNYIYQVIEFINTRMFNNVKIVKEQLTGIKWITQNPERQWTSSINPIVKHPKDFYGKYYTPLYLFIPVEVETTLRLIRKKQREGVFGISMPPDVFRLILSYIARAYINNFSWFDEHQKWYSIQKQKEIPKVVTITEVDIAKQKLQNVLNLQVMGKNYFYKGVTPVESTFEPGYILQEVAEMQKLNPTKFISKASVDEHLIKESMYLKEFYNKGLKKEEPFPNTNNIKNDNNLTSIVRNPEDFMKVVIKPQPVLSAMLGFKTPKPNVPFAQSTTHQPDSQILNLMTFLEQQTLNKK